MITPAPGITVLDGMAALAGLRAAGAKRSVPQVELAHPVRRSFEDRLDLSADARDAAGHQRGATVPQAASGLGRLIDVVA
ncbi:MAG: hypothetical protein ACYTE6_01590 [Planctomycetota bacterium]|jgi:hypothetical protein